MIIKCCVKILVPLKLKGVFLLTSSGPACHYERLLTVLTNVDIWWNRSDHCREF